MTTIERITISLLFATVFTLPMYMRVNNLILGGFLVAALVLALQKGTFRDLGKGLYLGLPIVVFFGLAIFGAFRDFSLDNFQYLEKYWSLLLLPMVMLAIPGFYARHKPAIFKALLWGCITTLLICYGAAVWEMISGSEPLSYFFRWRHLGHQFTDVADTHPTYLAVFIVMVIFFLIQDTSASYLLKSIAVPFLILGLFQLASRIGLFLLILVLVFVLIQRIRHNRWQVAGVVFGLVLSGLLVQYYGSEYLTRRLFSAEAISGDRRVARWEISYEIFKDHPLAGVGYRKLKPLRQQAYIKGGFDQAAAEEYNAHNQFLEYLSTQGAIGGIVYGLSLTYLFLLAIYRRDILFGFVFFAFLVANTTESMLVRIKGIEYFALFGTLFLCTVFSPKTEHEDLHHT